MPVGAEIFATSEVFLKEEDVKKLNDDLMNQIGHDRFVGPAECALTLVLPDEYNLFEEVLTNSATLIEAHPVTAYYGAGYERGLWPELAAIIEFLKRRVPTVRAWYGSDTYGEVTETTAQWMSLMWDYWAENGNRPYQDRMRRGNSPETEETDSAH